MITIEQIDEFRKRTHSSYADAKYFLEKNNGDVLEAIIDFERSKTGKSYCNNRQGHRHNEDFGKKFAEVVQKGFDTRVFVEDKTSTLFNIPIILLLLFIPLWFFVLIGFIFFAMLGYKVSIKDVKSQNINVNAFFQNISDKMKETNPGANKAPQQQKPNYPVPSNINVPASNDKNAQPPAQNGDANKDEGYKEYTIE